MAGDMLSDATGAIGGMNTMMGGNLVGVLISIQVPLILVFLGVTGVLFMLLFGQKFVYIPPWGFKINVTSLIPYADGKLAVQQDKGALCNVGGLKRFKIKKENILMQKPDTSDVYPNNEVIIVSLGAQKKFNAKRKIIRETHEILFDVENPQVAQQFYVDTVQENDPNLFIKKIDQLYLLWVLWFFSGVMVASSNFLIIYPIFVKILFMGGMAGN